MVSSKKFSEQLKVRCGLAESAGAADASTNPHKMNIDDRSLKAFCQNCVVVSLLTFSETHHKRLLAIIINGQAPAMAQHTAESRIRDVESQEDLDRHDHRRLRAAL